MATQDDIHNDLVSRYDDTRERYAPSAITEDFDDDYMPSWAVGLSREEIRVEAARRRRGLIRLS